MRFSFALVRLFLDWPCTSKLCDDWFAFFNAMCGVWPHQEWMTARTNESCTAFFFLFVQCFYCVVNCCSSRVLCSLFLHCVSLFVVVRVVWSVFDVLPVFQLCSVLVSLCNAFLCVRFVRIVYILCLQASCSCFSFLFVVSVYRSTCMSFLVAFLCLWLFCLCCSVCFDC